ncbi:uncharacterized protein FIBRA_08358 [Fibroporia radiculosa]|uniref:DUF803-domain-containing protein n=1 Tax=Fibroporia radiculosa TaxID=599839 RepID=J4H547_9APHY|nr:uncharacterized protein FIBRA_08358 [Fibroporia radiculosa]CCM06109.1 predicted protein [Fibroporia radiculosa]
MSSSSLSPTSTSQAAASASSAVSGTLTIPGNLKARCSPFAHNHWGLILMVLCFQIVGILLAISSGVLIGTSFVFKKRGLLRSQKGLVAGEGVAYLKSPLWWTGMIMMILGEICNFVAYAFVEAIVVTPMGALSVVICAILSHFFLQEKLSFFGWLGCGLCIIGSVIIGLNGPQEASVGQITQFQSMFLAPGFLVYGSILIAASLSIIFIFAPRYGTKSMLWYIMVCSMIGGISVSVTTGLGSAIVTTAMGDNQFKHWFIYFLMAFIAVTLITEVYYLNKALALFNTAMVTPTYYVIFTFFSILTTIVLFQGLKASATQIITLVMGFVVICFGITILQLSKVDPTQIKLLDRRSTILLQAARRDTEGIDEKSLAAVEDPGIDALRGGFGMVGSVIRARSAHRMSMSSRATASARSRYSNAPSAYPGADPLAGLKRHQLWDAPVPSVSELSVPDADADRYSMASQPTMLGSPQPSARKQTIKFDSQDVVHSYSVPGFGDNTSKHEHRNASHNSMSPPEQPADVKSDFDAQVVAFPTDPSLEEARGETGMWTAPPMLGGNDGNDPYRHAQAYDIFDHPPSAKVGGTFTPDEMSPIDRRSTKSPPHHHHHPFWRSPGGRRYPSGSPDDDREQSEHLWQRESDDEESRGRSDGGIRLVSSTSRH